ncbi:aldehyde dehydrogenase family protein [Rhodococcus sp. NPDC057014]|uniref:aldehyde dehydrogenase family protein n=1 Tax=Rhodococcus sp. NPDC057014 TaxID=3346000 RepID=UPI0036363F0A
MSIATALHDSVTPEARAFLAAEQHHIIDGQSTPSQDGSTFETIDPSSEEVLTRVAYGREADVDNAVQAARNAFAVGSPWRRMAAADRGLALAKLADLLERHADELADLESLDNGKPRRFARQGDIPSSIAILRYHSGSPARIQGRTVPVRGRDVFAYTTREPVGVCALIVPWNFPLGMAVWKIAPALAAGCTMVLKPAEQTPLTAIRLAQLALEAGIPPGVLNVVTGDGETGKALVAHPGVDKVAFTGSTAVGRAIGERAGRDLKSVTLELGGKSPLIVMPDADLEQVIKRAFAGIYYNSGQVCSASSRLLAHKSIFDDVVAGIAEKARTSIIGSGFEDNVYLGPLVSREQHTRVAGYIEGGRGQAELVAGGETRLDRPGYFVEPTLFTTTDDDAPLVRDEIFGPVLVAQPFESLEEVAHRASDTEYGLAAGVFTRDLSTAHKVAGLLRAGSVYVNCWGLADPAAPFGGFGASGIGREHGEEGLAAYLEPKSTFVQLG